MLSMRKAITMIMMLLDGETFVNFDNIWQLQKNTRLDHPVQQKKDIWRFYPVIEWTWFCYGLTPCRMCLAKWLLMSFLFPYFFLWQQGRKVNWWLLQKNSKNLNEYQCFHFNMQQFDISMFSIFCNEKLFAVW